MGKIEYFRRRRYATSIVSITKLKVKMASTKSSNETEENNKHAPPSSCEEAAELLGAEISFDTSSSNVVLKHQEGQSNPPQGMHSIFTVQEPIPNQVLFIRLCNLRAWLRWHASGLDDPPSGLDNDDSVSEIICSCIDMQY